MIEKIETQPAFRGAAFDKRGFCLNHSTFQLANPTKIEGKLVYEELRRNCPFCISDKNKSKRTTSLGGGKVRRGHLHGTPSPLVKKSSSKSSQQSLKKQRKEYDTPFDKKGRCHYHKNVQLAGKKLGGGWKVLLNACPKCIDENCDDEEDNRTIKSGSSKRSTRSKVIKAKGQFDRNGCCLIHSHIQVARKKVLGSWKVTRECPACAGEENIGLNDDRISVCSKSSQKSGRSASSRSAKSTPSTRSRGRSGKAASSSRYGSLPFDGDGYCCRHPGVLLAQKKMMGGWKILHDVCPECRTEKGTKTPKKPQRRKSRTGRVFDTSGSETSSFKSSSVASSIGKKKRLRVRSLKIEDENGKPGKYTGDVNEEYKPNGQGKMKYNDGTVYEGVWSEGSQVHGKTTKKYTKKAKAIAAQ